MHYDDICKAYDEARAIMRESEYHSKMGVERAAGRLRLLSLSHDTLVRLKRELSAYNVHKRKWSI